MSGSSWGTSHLGMTLAWCAECSFAIGKDSFSWNLTSDLEVARVDEGGAAAAAGLRPGDILTHVDDHPVRTDEAGRLLVLSNQEGTTLRIRYLRGTEAHETALVIR